jgi:hypothetical protein
MSDPHVFIHRRSRRAAVLLAATALWCSLAPTAASAANLEPAGINLGGTSFFDGFGRNTGGFTYIAYFQYAMAREVHGSLQASGDDSQPLPIINDPEIDVFVLINQLIYTVPEGLFDDSAHVGINFLLPVIAFDTSFAPPPPFPGTQFTDNGIGVGDLTFGPMLQFEPVMAGGRPVFSNRFEVDLIVPTGKYDPGIDINQSSNFVSLVPYWAATVLPLPHLELSVRLHYLYNFKNMRPALGRLYGNEVPPPVKSAQAGQAGWINFASSYEILRGFHLGANGYYFHQFNLDLWEMLDGTSNPGLSFADTGKLRIFGVGPGVMWSVADHDKLFANVYFQLLVENGPQSNVVNLRWVHGFP